MSNQAVLAATTPTARLAQFFPGAAPVRLRVQVEREGGNREETVIEFGTRHEALFACAMELEFGEAVRLSNPDGSFQSEAQVVAMQFAGGRAAVAVRFAQDPTNWIVR